MKTIIIASMALALMFAVPAVSHAATYQYVDVAGNVREVEANDAVQALSVSDIASTSGVLLKTVFTAISNAIKVNIA